MSPRRRVRALAATAALGVAAACGGAPRTAAPPSPPAPSEAAAAPVPPGVHWFRTAAEQRAVYEEVYRMAAAAVERLATGRSGGAWAVILDADETVLDNSTYQRRRALAGLGYTAESWNDWVREEAAPALPGAVAFARRVHELGGRVAIVTNRDDVVCDATRRNLRTEGVEADVVLCRTGESSKEARFRAVADGTAPGETGPLEVLAWVGDNIQDFPGGTQAWREGTLPAEIGTRWFVLPNPMYGSWTANPER